MVEEKRKGPKLARQKILLFLAKAQAVVESEDTRKALLENERPLPHILALLREIWKEVDVQPEHGEAQLDRLLDDFPTDHQLLERGHVFHQAQARAVLRALEDQPMPSTFQTEGSIPKTTALAFFDASNCAMEMDDFLTECEETVRADAAAADRVAARQRALLERLGLEPAFAAQSIRALAESDDAQVRAAWTEHEKRAKRTLELAAERAARAPFEPVARADLLAFFADAQRRMESAEIRERLKQYGSLGPRLQERLLEFQHEAFDAIKVPRDKGALQLQRLDRDFPEDEGVVTAARAFQQSAMKAYLRCIEDRAPPKRKLAKKGRISKELAVEYVHACVLRYQLGESVAELVKLGDDAEKGRAIVTKWQQELMEWFGFDGEYGISAMMRLPQEHPGDADVAHLVNHWCIASAQVVADAQEQAAVAQLEPELAAELDSLRALEPAASQKLAAMDDAGRRELLSRLGKKVMTFGKFKLPDRMRYSAKMSAADKLELVSAHILLRQGHGVMMPVATGPVGKAPASTGAAAPAVAATGYPSKEKAAGGQVASSGEELGK